MGQWQYFQRTCDLSNARVQIFDTTVPDVLLTSGMMSTFFFSDLFNFLPSTHLCKVRLVERPWYSNTLQYRSVWCACIKHSTSLHAVMLASATTLWWILWTDCCCRAVFPQTAFFHIVTINIPRPVIALPSWMLSRCAVLFVVKSMMIQYFTPVEDYLTWIKLAPILIESSQSNRLYIGKKMKRWQLNSCFCALNVMYKSSFCNRPTQG